MRRLAVCVRICKSASGILLTMDTESELARRLRGMVPQSAWIYAAVAALCLSGCVVNSPSNRGQPPPKPRFAGPAVPNATQTMDVTQALGLWHSSFGAVKIDMDAGQGGAELMGIWLYDRAGQEVVGFFAGPLKGNVLEFSWHEPAQPSALMGGGYLIFEPDGQRFQGQWWTSDRSRSGDWNGWRQSPAPPPPPRSYGDSSWQ